MIEPGEARLVMAGSQSWGYGKVKPPLPARWRPCERPYRVPGAVRWREFQNGEEPEQVYVHCQTCETCIARRQHDVVGRAIAESVGCDAAFFVTLTFGGDRYYGSTANNPRAQGLDRSLVESYIDRLRKYLVFDAHEQFLDVHGHDSGFVRPKLRFLSVGEFGDLKARPHFHLLLFLYGAQVVPDMCLDEDFFHGRMHESVDTRFMRQIVGARDREYWPWGFSNFEKFHPGHAAYVAEYITKTAVEREGGKPRFVVMKAGRSTKPMLGSLFLDWLAKRHVEDQLPIQDRVYRLPPDADPWQRKFFANGAAFMYLGRSYERQWYERAELDRNMAPHPPRSKFLDSFHKLEFKSVEDKRLLAMKAEEDADFRRRFLERMEAKYQAGDKPVWDYDYPVIRRPQRMIVDG